ncbi:MAG: sensor histidine kinase [Planctomycetota bacterium]
MPPAAEDAWGGGDPKRAPSSAHPRRRPRRSLLDRLITVLGLAFFVVELVVLAVFTGFQWLSMRAEREAHLSRWAASAQEPVRAALTAPVTSEAELDADVDAVLQNPHARRGGHPPTRFTPPAGAEVQVWVFSGQGDARRFTRDGRLLDPEESAWAGPVPAELEPYLRGEALAGTVRVERDRIVRAEPLLAAAAGARALPGNHVLYLETSLIDVQRQVASVGLVAFATGAVALLVTALVTLGYLRRTLLVPLARIIRADNAARREHPRGGLIDEADTPDDEVGEIIRSRNHLLQTIVAVQDERQRKHEELEQQREELRQWGRELEQLVQEKSRALLNARDTLYRTEKLAAVGRLAANVAHEINNPLASIAGYAEEAREELGEDHELAESLRTIEEQAFRCKDILKRLLGLARSDALNVTHTLLGRLVRQTVALADPGARRRAVEVRLAAFEGDGPELDTDEGSLQQVILNLVENAVDAAEQGDEPRWVEVALQDRPEALGLVVRDSGRGIPPEVRARVFDPFYTTKPVGRGTGLGLAICQSLVERLGGTIELESSERGATFTVWLPRAARPLRNLPHQDHTDGSSLVEAQLRAAHDGTDPDA